MIKLMYTATFRGPKIRGGMIAAKMDTVTVEVQVYQHTKVLWKARAAATRAEFAECSAPSADAAKKAVAQHFTKRISEWAVTDTQGYNLSPDDLAKAQGQPVKRTHEPLHARDADREDLSRTQMEYVTSLCGRRVYRMDLAQPGVAGTCSSCQATIRRQLKAKGKAEQEGMEESGN